MLFQVAAENGNAIESVASVWIRDALILWNGFSDKTQTISIGFALLKTSILPEGQVRNNV